MIKYPLRLGGGEEYGWRPTIVDYNGSPVIGLIATDLNRHSEPRFIDNRRADWAMAEEIVNALNAVDKTSCDHILNKKIPDDPSIVEVGENTNGNTLYCKKCHSVLYTEYSINKKCDVLVDIEEKE